MYWLWICAVPALLTLAVPAFLHIFLRYIIYFDIVVGKQFPETTVLRLHLSDLCSLLRKDHARQDNRCLHSVFRLLMQRWVLRQDSVNGEAPSAA